MAETANTKYCLKQNHEIIRCIMFKKSIIKIANIGQKKKMHKVGKFERKI